MRGGVPGLHLTLLSGAAWLPRVVAMTARTVPPAEAGFAAVARERLAAPRNPFTVIVNGLAWRSLCYCFTSILVGIVALGAGIIGFFALPSVMAETADFERRRLGMLGLRLPPRPVSADGRSGGQGGLAVWGTTVLFGLVDALPGSVIVGALLVGAGGLSVSNSGMLSVLYVIWLWGWLTAGAYVAWALASAQAQAVIAASSPPEAERQVAELANSRSELVDVFESERRRIERDLHDGAQQHLVVSTMHLGEAVYLLDSGQPDGARTAVLSAQDAVETALASLRDTIRGIHPQVLTDRGLVAAVQELAVRQPLPVTVRVGGDPRPLADPVESAAYYVTSEALTNVARHSGARTATVRLEYTGRLLLQITDDGHGGAGIVPGHGMSGLVERTQTAGGTFELASPPGGPTVITATFPYA